MEDLQPIKKHEPPATLAMFHAHVEKMRLKEKGGSQAKEEVKRHSLDNPKHNGIRERLNILKSQIRALQEMCDHKYFVNSDLKQECYYCEKLKTKYC